jgi:hypothetical protein
MAFSAQQIDAITLATRISSGLSMAGLLVIIITYVSWKRFRTPANRLMLYMAISDLVAMAAKFIGR